MQRITRSAIQLLPVLLVAAALVACNDDNGTGPNPAVTYDQIQRLGNPLVSEVFLAKRSHPQRSVPIRTSR